MAKQKDKIFQTLKHGPFEGHVRISKAGLFSAEFGPDYFSNANFAEVKGWLYERMRAHCNLRWLPVMEVHFDCEDQQINNSHNCSNLACRLERYYIAWTGEKWVQTPWVVQPSGTHICSPHDNSELEQPAMSDDMLMAERVRHARDFYQGPDHPDIEWPLTEEGFRHQREYVVKYTEDNWQTMLGILDKMRALRAGLNNLLAKKDGWNVLASIATGRGLLAAPKGGQDE